MTNLQKLYKLFRIACADLLVLQEMEWNGMLFNRKDAETYADELQTKIDALIRDWTSTINKDVVSIASGKHVSALLYGGTILEEFRIPVGYYKTGARKGEVKMGRKDIEHVFPQIVKPLKGSETVRGKKGDGACTEWSVSEDTLKQLKATGTAKKLITIILEYRKMEKLRGTYLVGYPKLIDEHGWEGNMLHGNFNQAVAVTGRLSSSAPNLQNMDKETKQFIISRYHTEDELTSEGGVLP